jgi:CDP-L-myo-inositol myo-inositolphosphotransferase
VSCEAWILAGAVDGGEDAADPLLEIAGLPLLLRHAGEAIGAGAERVKVIWLGEAPAPEIFSVAGDDRLRGRAIEVVTEIPAAVADRVLVIRGDRVFHRDLCKILVAAEPGAPLIAIEGDDYDGAFAADPEVARALAEAAGRPGGLTSEIARRAAATAPPPYLGFSVPAPLSAADRHALHRAEKRLVGSLRKAADGYAARLLNRRISLFASRHLARTPIRPNHVTVVCFLSALAGGATLAQGGYLCGVIGMLLVELGSILDGIDGELARLKLRFSRTGQWMDTVTDDLSNVFLATGTALNLEAAGVGWALPVLIAGLVAFALTQSSQYYLIATVYRSGDLAAIPWAFQSTDFLSSRPAGLIPRLKAGIPKLLKRDFTVTLFVALAIAGFLEGVLLLFAGGAIGFLISYSIQYLRVRGSLRSPSAG